MTTTQLSLSELTLKPLPAFFNGGQRARGGWKSSRFSGGRFGIFTCKLWSETGSIRIVLRTPGFCNSSTVFVPLFVFNKATGGGKCRGVPKGCMLSAGHANNMLFVPNQARSRPTSRLVHYCAGWTTALHTLRGNYVELFRLGARLW